MGQSWSHFVFYCTLMTWMMIYHHNWNYSQATASHTVSSTMLWIFLQSNMTWKNSYHGLKSSKCNSTLLKCYILRIHRAPSPIARSIYSSPGSSGSSALLRCYPVWVPELEGTYPACQEQSYCNTSLGVSLGFIKLRNFHSCSERDKE